MPSKEFRTLLEMFVGRSNVNLINFETVLITQTNQQKGTENFARSPRTTTNHLGVHSASRVQQNSTSFTEFSRNFQGTMAGVPKYVPNLGFLCFSRPIQLI